MISSCITAFLRARVYPVPGKSKELRAVWGFKDKFVQSDGIAVKGKYFIG